jgi:hypothetical protein
MPSAQDCAERLRDQAYRTLLPQIRDLEKELQNVNNSLAAGIHQIGQKLEALSHIELPTTELVLSEILGDVTRETNLKTNDLVRFAQDLHQKETQEEILSLLLDAAHRYLPQTALFAVRGSRYVGWSSRGYSEDIARTLSSTSFLRSDCPGFEEVLDGGTARMVSDFVECDALQFLKEEAAGDLILVPLRVLERPVALLLAGGAAATQSGTDTVSILAEFAVLRLENISLKILYELTAARRETGAPEQEESAAATAPMPVFEPAPEIPILPRAAAREELESVQQPEPRSDLESFQKPTPPPEVIAFESTEAPSVSQPEDAAEAAAPLPEPEFPKLQIPEVRHLPEEEKLHSDAKRFARLLVSEIKLYNEHHVAEGRENQDLYLRLKRDIDRSREMYEKRVSPNVSRRIDYFHDEIIRILGDNDPSTLGSDYPGPRVES